MVMTLMALIRLCSIAGGLPLSHDSGWRCSSDGSNEAAVCKHGEGEGVWPAVCQRVDKFAVFRKKPTLKWLAKVGFLGMERIWRLIGWKKHFGFTVDCYCNFFEHSVTASEGRSSVELEICSQLQNAKSLVLYKRLASPIFMCSSNLRKVAPWVSLQSRNHTSYFHNLFCCIRATWTFYVSSTQL